MAATDQHYRNQKTLDILFGVTCILMLLSIIGMFAQDFLREFKVEQRVFRDVETAMAERDLLNALPREQLQNLIAAEQMVAAAKKSGDESLQEDAAKELASAQAAMDEYLDRLVKLDQAAREARAHADKLKVEHQTAINEARVQRAKAEVTYQDIKARLDSIESLYYIAVDAAKPDDSAVNRLRGQVAQLREELETARVNLEQIDEKVKEAEKPVTLAELEFVRADSLLREERKRIDRTAALAKQKQWTIYDELRSMPVIDGFSSPYKINQYTLDTLPIDYSFKHVTRYDRCTTCHLGMERASFDPKTLAELRDPRAHKQYAAELKKLREVLQKRKDQGKDLGGFDLDLLPAAVQGITQAKLTDARLTQYAAHPRLDLFVDSNSPHSAEKFGCSICHSGQGSATDFKQATHSPNNPEQKEAWVREFGWFSNHYWDFPMLPRRFTESSCLKCHHQVTDLIRHGNREEAPKLLKGYNLIRENGCYGCHEIAGMKGGRWIGPDMRLEDGIPLEEKTPAERVKALADTANPPGTMRKVGPSLFRLGEKTNYDWLVKWLKSPRTFRDDTRMPHFYDLSTNSEAYLAAEDAKRSDKSKAQEKYPAAEIHSIAHYLMEESKAYLKGDDIYTRGLKLRKQQLLALQDKLKADGLDLGRGEIEELAKIDRELTHQAPPPVLELRDRFPALATGVLVDGNGVPIAIPDAAGDNADNGRRLFIEKGCMACHKHDGTTTNPIAGVAPTLNGHATFGPNLSEVAFKLGTGAGDKKSARLWLIQWVLNPMIHHPRTRMPVTHLTEREAADVAAWLLTESEMWAEGEGKSFLAMNVPAPERQTLESMTRLLLRRTRSQQEVDDLIAPKDEEAKKRAQAWLTSPSLRADSDEAMLQGELTDDKLKLFIGRKAIGRLGCFGCHNIPGFETSKPIGTPLNDWGKKDAERLAFEDGVAFVESKYNIVSSRITREELDKLRTKLLELKQKVKESVATAAEKSEAEKLDVEVKKLTAASAEKVSRDPGTGKPIHRPHEEHVEGGLWSVKDGRDPYEEYFFDSLEHHHRDGFLHLKLAEPRSYDYKRDRDWDDRLRMPQFKFARPTREYHETETAFQDRRSLEEAEAREAVMTFVLGLVAEPVPERFVHHPAPDRAAEVRGRQVLDKFNCAGCHLIRPGIYDLKPSEELLKKLAKLHGEEINSQNAKDDHVFPDHNAWTGLPPFWPGTLTAFGRVIPDPTSSDVYLRLMQAVQLPKGTVQLDPNLRSFATLELKPEDILQATEPYGGAFTELLAAPRPNPSNPEEPLRPWLVAKDSAKFDAAKDNARASLPPMLWRQGERTQPDWLFRFLKDPKPLRPLAILRMPKFNLSDDDTRALVDYFAAVDRLTNPDIGLVYPYSAMPQNQEKFWRERTKEYVQTWDDDRLIARAGELIAYFEQRLKDAEAAVKVAQEVESKADMNTKASATASRQKAEAARDAAKADLDAVKSSAGKMNVKEEREKLRRLWEQSDVYAQDAYRILANKNSVCLTCHQVGSIVPKEHQGPPLGDVWERLRPEWTLRWIASPQRMIYYNTPMPMNFPKTKRDYLEWFNTNAQDPHLSLRQATAVRDVLMNFPKVADSPTARKFREDQGGVK